MTSANDIAHIVVSDGVLRIESDLKTTLDLGPVLSRLGVIADVQYCDREDTLNFHKTALRYYRNSLVHLQNAISEWMNTGQSQEPCSPRVDHVLQLGDIIDGFSHRNGKRDEDFNQISKVVEKLGSIPSHYCIGNHELYNFTREELASLPICSLLTQQALIHRPDLFDKPRSPIYYSFKPCPGYRILIVDSFDVSILGWQNMECDEYKSLRSWLVERNGNKDLNDSADLSEPRMVAFNGAISPAQLQWIDEELGDCVKKNERAIIASHAPLHANASDTINTIWNIDEVLHVLHKYSQTVCLVITGHFHQAGWTIDHGILHITMPGIIEVPPDKTGHAVLTLCQNGLQLSSSKTCPQFTLLFQT